MSEPGATADYRPFDFGLALTVLAARKGVNYECVWTMR